MVGIGGFLNKRAHVWRDVETGTDDYGQPIVSNQLVGAEIPCRTWYRRGARNENDTTTIIAYELKAAFFRNAEVQTGDKLEIYNPCGEKEIDGVQIDAIMKRDKYLDCVLKEYT
jgi:hypothetical protein